MRVAGLFPGQGSQSVGMGKAFFQENAIAKEVFEQADRTLGFSISKLCFEGPLEELTLTQNAQPALLTSSYVAFLVAGIPLVAAAGHSLGEYSALVAAGSLSFEDAVALVHKRGRYMQEAVRPGAGKMLAVMGPTEQEILEVSKQISSGTVEIANLNSPGQIVVAGDAAGIDDFAKEIGSKGAKVIPLNVSAPFHCSLMQPAAEKLALDLNATTFQSPKFPVYSNVLAQAISSGDEARDLLKRQVCSSVRWTDSMMRLMESEHISHSVEFGPGGVLSKLLKRIVPKTVRLEAFDPTSTANVKTTLAQ